jgi:hypothetical protein
MGPRPGMPLVDFQQQCNSLLTYSINTDDTSLLDYEPSTKDASEQA